MATNDTSRIEDLEYQLQQLKQRLETSVATQYRSAQRLEASLVALSELKQRLMASLVAQSEISRRFDGWERIMMQQAFEKYREREVAMASSGGINDQPGPSHRLEGRKSGGFPNARNDEAMAYSEHGNTAINLYQANTPRRPRILLACSGSVAAVKFANLCHCFSEWAEVKAVCTQASLHFVDRAAIPNDVVLFTDAEEWSSWKKIGDQVLHIELRKWADIMVIAPLSANTLAKLAGGLCDNLLTCIVRAWDYSKAVFIAPAMNTLMWDNPFTERPLVAVDDLGMTLIPPVKKKLACGDYGNGAMAEPADIFSTVRFFYEAKIQPKADNA